MYFLRELSDLTSYITVLLLVACGVHPASFWYEAGPATGAAPLSTLTYHLVSRAPGGGRQRDRGGDALHASSGRAGKVRITAFSTVS